MSSTESAKASVLTDSRRRQRNAATSASFRTPAWSIPGLVRKGFIGLVLAFAFCKSPKGATALEFEQGVSWEQPVPAQQVVGCWKSNFQEKEKNFTAFESMSCPNGTSLSFLSSYPAVSYEGDPFDISCNINIQRYLEKNCTKEISCPVLYWKSDTCVGDKLCPPFPDVENVLTVSRQIKRQAETRSFSLGSSTAYFEDGIINFSEADARLRSGTFTSMCSVIVPTFNAGRPVNFIGLTVSSSFQVLPIPSQALDGETPVCWNTTTQRPLSECPKNTSLELQPFGSGTLAAGENIAVNMTFSNTDNAVKQISLVACEDVSKACSPFALPLNKNESAPTTMKVQFLLDTDAGGQTNNVTFVRSEIIEGPFPAGVDQNVSVPIKLPEGAYTLVARITYANGVLASVATVVRAKQSPTTVAPTTATPTPPVNDSTEKPEEDAGGLSPTVIGLICGITVLAVGLCFLLFATIRLKSELDKAAYHAHNKFDHSFMSSRAGDYLEDRSLFSSVGSTWSSKKPRTPPLPPSRPRHLPVDRIGSDDSGSQVSDSALRSYVDGQLQAQAAANTMVNLADLREYTSQLLEERTDEEHDLAVFSDEEELDDYFSVGSSNDPFSRKSGSVTRSTRGIILYDGPYKL